MILYVLSSEERVIPSAAAVILSRAVFGEGSPAEYGHLKRSEGSPATHYTLGKLKINLVHSPSTDWQLITPLNNLITSRQNVSPIPEPCRAAEKKGSKMRESV